MPEPSLLIGRICGGLGQWEEAARGLPQERRRGGRRARPLPGKVLGLRGQRGDVKGRVYGPGLALRPCLHLGQRQRRPI